MRIDECTAANVVNGGHPWKFTSNTGALLPKGTGIPPVSKLVDLAGIKAPAFENMFGNLYLRFTCIDGCSTAMLNRKFYATSIEENDDPRDEVAGTMRGFFVTGHNNVVEATVDVVWNNGTTELVVGGMSYMGHDVHVVGHIEDGTGIEHADFCYDVDGDLAWL